MQLEQVSRFFEGFIMYTVILFLISTYSLAIAQNDERPSPLPETVFKGKTFLPAIVPLKVQKITEDNGDVKVTVDVLYSEESSISWIAHGLHHSYIDRVNLRVTGSVPDNYILQIHIPREVIDTRNDSNLNVVFEKHSAEGVLKLEDGDILVDYNQLYIKFQTLDLSEAAVLKISLENDADDDIDEVDVNNVGVNNYTKFVSSYTAVPKFPEMVDIDGNIHIVTSGRRTVIFLDVLFTDNDRYSVRGLLYNSTSNTLFTTFWSTDFLLGQSDFSKISNNEHGEEDLNVDDNVILVDTFGSQESLSIRQIVIDVPTQNNDITGVYSIRSHHEASFEDEGFIVESSLEQVVVVKRDNEEHGPIPTGVLQFEGGSYSQITCYTGIHCLITCRVYGVSVQSLHLMHKNSASQFVILRGEDIDLGSYESVATILVDSTNSYNSGTYICKAESGPISINKEIDLNFVDE